MTCNNCFYFPYCKVKCGITATTKACSDYYKAFTYKVKSCKNCLYYSYCLATYKASEIYLCKSWRTNRCHCGKRLDLVNKSFPKKYYPKSCSDKCRRMLASITTVKALNLPAAKIRHLAGIRNPERKRKWLEALSKTVNDPTYKAKFIRAIRKTAKARGKTHSENWKKNPENKKKHTIAVRAAMAKPEWRQNLLAGVNDPISKAKSTESKRMFWRNLKPAERMTRLSKLLPTDRPNKSEAYLQEIVPNLKYVGNRKFWRLLPGWGNKNPDFLVVPFKVTQKVMELFGDYWHTEEEAKKLITAYRKAGIKCFIIWSSELNNNTRIQEAIDFAKAA